MRVKLPFCLLLLLLPSASLFAQVADPIKEYRKLFSISIAKGDVDEMRVILRLGYVAPDDPPGGALSWVSSACYYAPKGDLGPVKLMVEKGADLFERYGNVLNWCALSGESSKFFYVLDAMHEQSSEKHMRPDVWLNSRNLGSVLISAKAGAQNAQDLVERDATAVLEIKRMVQYGLTRDEILKKDIPDLMQGWNHPHNGISFAKDENLKQSEAYLGSVVGN